MLWFVHGVELERARKAAAAKLSADFDAALQAAETAAAEHQVAPETASDGQAVPPAVDGRRRRR